MINNSIIYFIAKLARWFIGILIITILFSLDPNNWFFAILSNPIFGIPFLILFYLSALAAILNWIYCFIYWWRNERPSNTFYLLVFLNVLYAPLYFYRVKIMERPFISRIQNSDPDTTVEDSTASDVKFIEVTRENIYDLINLLSSKENQLNFKVNNPETDVSSELFFLWDSLYIPHSKDFTNSFSNEELIAFESLDSIMKEIDLKTQRKLPDIELFVESDEWSKISEAAMEIIKKFDYC